MVSWSDLTAQTLSGYVELIAKSFYLPKNTVRFWKTVAFRTVIRTQAMIQWMLAPKVLLQLLLRHFIAVIVMYIAYASFLVNRLFRI
jgi:hypothetical protein